MRKGLRLILVLAAFAAVAALAQQEQVEITSEPDHHLVLNNTFVRVFDVTVPPKASTLVHRHNYDYLFVTLGDSDVTSVRAGAPPAKLVLKDGEVRFTPGGFAHAAINNADRPFRNITIEVLGKTSNEHNCTERCSIPIPCDAPDKAACPTVQRMLMSDQWIVSTVTLPAGSSIPEHTPGGVHLVVALTNSDLRHRAQGQDREVHTKVGDLSWQQPVAHSVTNAGNLPARFVVVEFMANTDDAK